MDKNLENETAQADVTETVTNTESNEQSDDSSSSQETDYEALIEAERKPDPDKAKEAFRKREEKRKQEETVVEEEVIIEEDKPLTRKELDTYLARKTHEIIAEANAERIQEIATSIAESDGEARFIMEIHKNRVFPEGMSIREQLEEAKAIATAKRVAAKNVELARKVNSKETASKDTSTGTYETTTSEPKLSADLKNSLRNAGFTFDNTLKVYTKTLPNGKKMYSDPKTGRKGML
jgi:hypothetical protein